MSLEQNALNEQEEALSLPAPERIVDTLLECSMWMCQYQSAPRSAESFCAGIPKGNLLTPSQAISALGNANLTAGMVRRRAHEFSAHLMPIILLRKDRGAVILLSSRRDEKGKLFFQVLMPELSLEKPVEISHEELAEWYSEHAILVKPGAKIDSRAGEETPHGPGHWLFSTLWRYRSYYRSAALAAVIVNILALASIFFTMNVYDRVVPNQAYVTLWSLAIGVAIAMGFEAITRFIRARLLDVAAKKADLVLGSRLFRQALGVRMEHKPSSAGAFANQLREFESVRDFFTSATLAAITDLPFVLLFVGVIFMIGGPLGWIPLLMIPCIILISVGIQWPLARTMRENLRESSLKQGVLLESVEGMETLKSVSGEAYMTRRWEAFSAAAASTSMKSRQLSSSALNLVTFLQQLQTVVLVVVGVYLIGAGSLSQGALIGTVMLASRATAPLTQVAGLAVRFQQAKAALTSLNRLMAMPLDREVDKKYLPMPSLRGSLELKGMKFAYPSPPDKPNPPVLDNVNVTIQPNERVAILGKIGSGKSTLLRLIARLYQPTEGQMLIGGIDVAQVDPADWRKTVGYVGQDARLFYGTLRENVMIGRPDASTDELLRVLQLTGLDHVAQKHPMGINLPIGEMGEGLSGGQRQLVSLARSLLARPQILLLDEPTSAMDTQTEAIFMQRLHNATQGQTLILVTHRTSLLNLVDRILIVDEGRVVADGPKKDIIAALSVNPGEKASAA
ncbi:type I secretion system permease/ATPase [Enterobacter sp. CC120223-11]|uniref:type I secretion system permease/ATPase n=1 Tax=Enterobacter sp. CC120223-11 TaxID=1378073 RepID=UPI000BD63B7C|nr:type I secretion system permease/ATPase [Enterobacter sp. CC120223-11]SNY69719.1 ATP-binding cassette, subfamily C, LapB [Enterobacter sp. CC120223-11]